MYLRLSYHILNEFHNFLLSWSNDSSLFTLPVTFGESIHTFIENPSIDVGMFNCYCVALYFTAMAGTFLMLFVEIEKGYLERTLVAGVSSAEILLGLMIVQIPLLIIQGITVTILFSILHTDYMRGSWLLMSFLYFFISLAGSMLGVFLSVITTQSYLPVLGGALYTIASGCVNAAINPIEAMPYYFQYFCKATPLYFPVHALLDIVQHGWGLLHPSVVHGFLVAFIWTFVTFTLSIFRLLSFKINK